MPKTYQFTDEQIAELESATKKNKNKNVDKRLKALLLRGRGMKRAAVAEKTGFSVPHIIQLTSNYQNDGIGAIIESHYPGNNRNLSLEEEVGRTFEKDHGCIYRVLKRHGFRKVMPRSKHPNKASDEAIQASKKLT